MIYSSSKNKRIKLNYQNRPTFIFLFLTLLNFSFGQVIDNKKVFHFTLNGINDTLDLIQGIELEYTGETIINDTNRYGEMNKAVALNNAQLEILDYSKYQMSPDTSFSLSFWLNFEDSPYEPELQEFFGWGGIGGIGIRSYNGYLMPSDGGYIDFSTVFQDLLHFVIVYDNQDFKISRFI